MPPDYLMRYPTGESTSENYAVYASGLVRRVGAQELSYLRDDLQITRIDLQDENHRNRLAQVDAALRGQ